MLAARAHAGERTFRIEEVPVPKPGPDEVLVRVEAAGITRGLIAMWWFTETIALPSTLGHDFCGTVAAVGPGDMTAREGDRVWVSTALTCGSCRFCLGGEDNLCDALGVMGYALYSPRGRERYLRYRHGGLAEYALAPAANLNQLPDAIPAAVAAKLGTLAGCLRALLSAGARPGGSLIVAAAGGATGGGVVRLATAVGLGRVAAISRSRVGLERLASGQSPGLTALATEGLPAGWEQRSDLTDALRDLEPSGFDTLVDLSPVGADVTLQALRALRPGGHAMLMGGNVQQLTLQYLELMRNQWRIEGTRGHRRADELAVASLIATERFEAGDLVTHRFPLEQVNHAIDVVMLRPGHPAFVVVTP